MPFLEHQGERLAFASEGPEDGPAVILQHPLCSAPGCFEETSLKQTLLARGHRVILPTSIAHGESSTPEDPERYKLRQRVGDIVAIMDHLDVERAAFVGYSMGTWLGCGMLAFHPERVVGASLGGFDVVKGAHSCGIPLSITGSKVGLGLLGAYAMWSGSRIQLGEHSLEALQRCFLALYEPMPLLEQLSAAGVPVALWGAKHDLYSKHMRRAAAQIGVPFVGRPGHHFSASSDEAFVPQILRLIQQAWG